jgi:phosphoenolpyruvate carboxykinase (GTP)
MPRFEDLNWQGLDKLSPAQYGELTRVDAGSWKEELALQDEFFSKLGKRLPQALDLRRGRMHERLAA